MARQIESTAAAAAPKAKSSRKKYQSPPKDRGRLPNGDDEEEGEERDEESTKLGAKESNENRSQNRPQDLGVGIATDFATINATGKRHRASGTLRRSLNMVSRVMNTNARSAGISWPSRLPRRARVPGSKFLRVCSPAIFLTSPKLKYCSSSATVPTIRASIISFGSRQWQATRCLLRHPLLYQSPRPPQKHLARPVVSAPLRPPVKSTLPAPGNCVAATVLKPALVPWDRTNVTATRSSSDSLWQQDRPPPHLYRPRIDPDRAEKLRYLDTLPGLKSPTPASDDEDDAAQLALGIHLSSMSNPSRSQPQSSEGAGPSRQPMPSYGPLRLPTSIQQAGRSHEFGLTSSPSPSNDFLRPLSSSPNFPATIPLPDIPSIAPPPMCSPVKKAVATKPLRITTQLNNQWMSSDNDPPSPSTFHIKKGITRRFVVVYWHESNPHLQEDKGHTTFIIDAHRQL
ncbi:hypothetical protein B0H14DRAFT_2576163 [Mycena olivaceomarginata]|nr:hypothetical protein B0H14DRAFT_2576163 [Mycena olivaceomarginata]